MKTGPKKGLLIANNALNREEESLISKLTLKTECLLASGMPIACSIYARMLLEFTLRQTRHDIPPLKKASANLTIVFDQNLQPVHLRHRQN